MSASAWSSTRSRTSSPALIQSPRASPTPHSTQSATRGTYFWSDPPGRSGGLAFLFPGEGSQYAGMLADVCPHFPEVRGLFDTADRLALESGAIAPPSSSLFSGRSTDTELWETGTAVNVVLSSQWALYHLLRHLGLNPSAVAGHSSGEFLALAAAGAVRVDRGLEQHFNDLAAVFARLDPDGVVAPGRLVGVAAGRERVEAVIEEFAGSVSVAVDNCPHQVVVAGPPADVEGVVARLRDRGMMVEELPFTRAYHTPAFAPLVGPVRDFFEGLDVSSPTVPLYSCSSAGVVPADPFEVRRLAIAQWTRPVEFRRTVEAMHADGVRLFVDVGAGQPRRVRRGHAPRQARVRRRREPAKAIGPDSAQSPGRVALRSGHRSHARIPLRDGGRGSST